MSAKQPNAKYKITRFLVQDVLVVKDGIGRPHHLGGYLSGLYEGWVRTSSDDLFLSSNLSGLSNGLLKRFSDNLFSKRYM